MAHRLIYRNDRSIYIMGLPSPSRGLQTCTRSNMLAPVKVEEPLHISHLISYKFNDEMGELADVFINEIWDISRSLRDSPVPPRPTNPPLHARGGPRGQKRHARPRPQISSTEPSVLIGRAHRAFHCPSIASFNDIRAMLAVDERTKMQLFPRRSPGVRVSLRHDGVRLQVRTPL